MQRNLLNIDYSYIKRVSRNSLVPNIRYNLQLLLFLKDYTMLCKKKKKNWIDKEK